MVRPKKVIVVSKSTRPVKEAEEPSDANGSLMVQSRSRRTIKPNPKYNSKEIITLKRHSSGDEDDDDEDEENGGEGDDNSEDDEDFHDDGAKDSDGEDEPRTRKRGRPRMSEAPRSEPPPLRKLQQMRAGLKEATMSASKAMQVHVGATALDKKRKLDYDDDSGEPDGKRGRISVVAASTATNTRGTTRVVGTAATTSEKENAKKNENSSSNNAGPMRILNLEKDLGTKSALARISPGVSTRRQQTVITTSTAVAKPLISTPKTAVTIRTNSPATATGTPKALSVGVKDTTPKSMIQVRRATPMNSSPNETPAAVSLPAINKGRVILNRPPMVKTKAQLTTTPVAIKTQSPIKITPTIRALATRGAQPIVIANKSSTPVTPTAVATPITTTNITPRIQNSVRMPPVKVIAEHTTIVKTASATLTIPKGAEMVQMPDGTTARITSLESRYVVRVPPEEDPLKDAAQHEVIDLSSLSLLELRYDIKKLKLPNDRWSYQLKLMKLSGVNNVEVPDRPGFAVHSISLNRVQSTSDDENQLSAALVNGRARPKMDRTVELLKDRLTINIEGKLVKLLGAPEEVTDMEELETLLEIVDHVELDSLVVRPCKAVVQM